MRSWVRISSTPSTFFSFIVFCTIFVTVLRKGRKYHWTSSRDTTRSWIRGLALPLGKQKFSKEAQHTKNFFLKIVLFRRRPFVVQFFFLFCLFVLLLFSSLFPFLSHSFHCTFTCLSVFLSLSLQ